MNSPTRPAAGISPSNREQLSRLHRAFSGPFTPGEAAELLHSDHGSVADWLGYLSRNGWLARVRRGLYVVVPLEATEPSAWRADRWLVAQHVFDPCYIAGWSACEHWDLTDQLFRSTVVVTARPQRRSQVTIQGSDFLVAHRQESALFGTRPVWREGERVAISDPSRTIIDILDNPRLGGGIRHVSEIVSAYLVSEHRNDELLVSYGDRLGNRTVFKRLGFLVEMLGIEATDLVADCLARRSAGLAKLDPSIKHSGRIISRWGLRINSGVETEAAA